MNLFDKVLQHLLGHLEVCNNTVFEGTNRGDVARGTTQHTLCIYTHGLDNLLAQVMANSNHRWLVEDDSLFTHVDKSICCSQVNRQIT